jgi:hypothetical protein
MFFPPAWRTTSATLSMAVRLSAQNAMRLRSADDRPLPGSKKTRRPPALRFKQAIFFATLIHAKADRRQDLRIEFLGDRAISYPKIDVIEKTLAHTILFNPRRKLSTREATAQLAVIPSEAKRCRGTP